jgi:HSP20 family protein
MTLYAYSFPRRMARRWMESAQDGSATRYLAVNIADDHDAYVLTALLPGLKADDVSIQVLEDVVTIEGKMPEVESEYLLQELPSGSFRRELRLPAPLDAEHVDANITDGILTVRLPKAESARPRTIKVVAK